MDFIGQNKLVSILLIFLLSACSNQDDKSAENKTVKKGVDNVEQYTQQMIGVWETALLNIKVNSINGGEDSRTFTVQKAQFPQVLQIHNAHGIYRSDFSFTDVYLGKNDSILAEISGQWKIEGDSLKMYYSEPSPRILAYHVSFRSDSGLFNGKIDWDADGLRDDNFSGLSLRITTDIESHEKKLAGNQEL